MDTSLTTLRRYHKVELEKNIDNLTRLAREYNGTKPAASFHREELHRASEMIMGASIAAFGFALIMKLF